MPEYKLYRLDRNGRIASRVEFEAADDREAIIGARARVPDTASELWCNTRKVAVLPAADDRAKVGAL